MLDVTAYHVLDITADHVLDITAYHVLDITASHMLDIAAYHVLDITAYVCLSTVCNEGCTEHNVSVTVCIASSSVYCTRLTSDNSMLRDRQTDRQRELELENFNTQGR